MKKFAWIGAGCLVLGLIILCVSYAGKQAEIAEAIEESGADIQRIMDLVSDIDTELESAADAYDSVAGEAAIENITENLGNIRRYMSSVDNHYKKDVEVSEAIDAYISDNTSVASWEKYKQYIMGEYFTGSTDEEAADKLMKKVADSAEGNRVIVENLNHFAEGSNYKVYGNVTNNTSCTVKFVKVKVVMRDADGKLLDTKMIYACGDEGLAPGGTVKFECYMKEDTKAKSFSAEIYEYD